MKLKSSSVGCLAYVARRTYKPVTCRLLEFGGIAQLGMLIDVDCLTVFGAGVFSPHTCGLLRMVAICRAHCWQALLAAALHWLT
jgi:hypothetical protein